MLEKALVTGVVTWFVVMAVGLVVMSRSGPGRHAMFIGFAFAACVLGLVAAVTVVGKVS